MLSWVKRNSVFVIGILGLITFVIWLVLSSSLLAGVRGDLTARFLSGKLNQDVQINGGVDIDLGSILQVSAREIALTSQTLTDVNLAEIGEVQFDIALSDLLKGRFDWRDLRADKARVFLVADENGRSSWSTAEPETGGGVNDAQPPAAPSTSGAAGGEQNLVGLLAGNKVHFSNSSLYYQDARNGLDLDLALTSLDLRQEDQGAPVLLQGAGTLNDQELTMIGTFPQEDPFDFSVRFDQINVQIDGMPDQGGYGAGYSGTMAADIAELGQLLDLLKLEKSVSGVGQVSATFRSEQTAQYVDDLKVDVVLDSGPSLALTGDLGEMGNPDDVSVDVRILRYTPETLPPTTRSRRDLKLTGIDMRLIARPDDVPLREMVIATNGFALATGGEGPPPITVSDIKRTPDGLLRLGKTVLRIGPPKAPFLSLEGSVADALQLGGMDFEAILALPAAAMFAPELYQASEVLGLLSGGFRLKGNASRLGLSEFKAVSQGTDLWRLDATGSIANVINLSDVELDVAISVPSGATLLSALDLEPRKTGPFELTASVSSQGVEWDSAVSISVAESRLDLTAEFDLDRENPVIGRRIESDLIKIVDLSNIIAAAVQLSKLNDPGRTLTREGTPSEGLPAHGNIVQPLVLKTEESAELARSGQTAGDMNEHGNVVQPLVLKTPEPSEMTGSEQSDGDLQDHGNIVQPLILEGSELTALGQSSSDTPIGASALPGEGPLRNVTLKPLGEAILQSDMDLGVTIDLRRIEGVQGATSLESQLVIDGQKAQLGPVKFAYAGGRFEVTGAIDLATNPNELRLSGSAGGWDFGKIMQELGFKKQASGILNASFNVSGKNTSAQDFLASVSGRATVSMRNGSIDNQLLDLAGLGVIPWLFSKNRKQTAPIVCMRAPLSLSRGRIDTKYAVIETDLVQVVVNGTVDLRRKTLNVIGQPRRIGKPLSRSPWPFTAVGPVANPDVKVKDGPRRLRRRDGASTMPARRKLCVADILQLK